MAYVGVMLQQGRAFNELRPHKVGQGPGQFRGRRHDHDVPALPGQHDVQQSPLENRRLAVAARHRQREVAAPVDRLVDFRQHRQMVAAPRVRERLPAVEAEPCREVLFQPLALAAYLGRRVFMLLDAGNLAPGLYVPLPLGVG